MVTCTTPPFRAAVRLNSGVRCRLEFHRYYPFDKFKLPVGEQVFWHASNPTFHRSSGYGIVLTTHAVYLRGWMFSIGRSWQRIALHDIKRASFKDSQFFPCLKLTHTNGTTNFRTPYDWYTDEMDFDPKNLVQTACFIEHMRGGT